MSEPLTQRRVAGTVAGAAGLIAVMTVLARAVGFGRVVVFADAVRAGGVGEIYQAVNTVPNVLFEVAAGGILAAVAVPLIGRHLGSGDQERADRLGSALLTWALVVLVPIAALVALVADPLTALLIKARDPESHRVGAMMLRVFSVQIPLYGIGIILTAILQAHRRFLAAALAPLLSSVVVLLSYLWYGHLVGGATTPSTVPDTALAVLAWGTTAGVVALSLPLVVPALRAGWRWRPSLVVHPLDRRRIGALAGAGVLALLAQQGAVLVTLWLSGRAADPGVLPVQQYVQAVYLLPYAVLAVPIATSLFPALAQGEGAGTDTGSRALARGLRAIVLLTGLAAGVLLAAAPAVGAFFTVLDARRGAAGASPAALAALPTGLVTYAPGLVGFGLAALCTRALYVRGQALAAGGAVAAGWLAAAALPLLVVGEDASAARTLSALGLSSTAGMTLSGLLLALLVRRTWGAGALEGVSRSVAVGLVAMAAALAVGDLVTRGRVLDDLASALGIGVLAGLCALVAGLVVVMIGDRATIAAAVRRGRERRGRR